MIYSILERNRNSRKTTEMVLKDKMYNYIISLKTIYIGNPVFLFHPSKSEQDVNLTDFHYSRPSNHYVAHFMYPAFLLHPSIFIVPLY